MLINLSYSSKGGLKAGFEIGGFEEELKALEQYDVHISPMTDYWKVNVTGELLERIIKANYIHPSWKNMLSETPMSYEEFREEFIDDPLF